VVFLAKITGPSGVIDTTNNQGIWAADSDGHVRLVARTGDVLMVEGVPKVVTALSIFTSTQGTAGQTLNWNRAGDLVYKATFSDKTQAILKVVFP